MQKVCRAIRWIQCVFIVNTFDVRHMLSTAEFVARAVTVASPTVTGLVQKLKEAKAVEQ